MSLIGTYADTNNPTFTIDTFCMLIPMLSDYVKSSTGQEQFNYFKKVADKKILYSIFGADWELATSLYIAHELSEIITLSQKASDDLAEVAGSVGARGIVINESLGGAYNGYSYNQTMVNKPNAIYFNSTQFGQRLMSLYQQKGVICIGVATPD